MNKINNKKTGFTLVEIMVSVAIFAVIMVTGIGALVSVTNSYRVSQQNKQVNDSLNYSLESMTRELRLGQNYRSGAGDGGNQSAADGDRDSVGFLATDGRGYVVFRLEDGVIYRDKYPVFQNTLLNSSALTNRDEVEISFLEFRVMGTADLANDLDSNQPLVWIRIQANPPGDSGNVSTIQTLVSQRVLDA